MSLCDLKSMIILHIILVIKTMKKVLEKQEAIKDDTSRGNV